MDKELVDLANEAFDLKQASVKRAMTSAKPQFKLLYETELENIAKLRAAFAEIREQQKPK